MGKYFGTDGFRGEAGITLTADHSLVSMNMWGLTPDFLGVLEEGFKEFFEKEVPGNPQKAEYTCHTKRACTFQRRHPWKKSVWEQSGSGDTEQ